MEKNNDRSHSMESITESEEMLLLRTLAEQEEDEDSAPEFRPVTYDSSNDTGDEASSGSSCKLVKFPGFYRSSTKSSAPDGSLLESCRRVEEMLKAAIEQLSESMARKL
uniref:Fibrous sheath-interacting protein 1 n=1 Tax=Steinernema glaseri TaxID=37863 RepID=A0A1I8AKQ8_9BILA